MVFRSRSKYFYLPCTNLKAYFIKGFNFYRINMVDIRRWWLNDLRTSNTTDVWFCELNVFLPSIEGQLGRYTAITYGWCSCVTGCCGNDGDWIKDMSRFVAVSLILIGGGGGDERRGGGVVSRSWPEWGLIPFSVTHNLLWVCTKIVHTTPPPPTRMHEGAACVFPFSWEGGGGGEYLWAVVSEDFPRKPGKWGVFVVAHGNQYPR